MHQRSEPQNTEGKKLIELKGEIDQPTIKVGTSTSHSQQLIVLLNRK